MNTPHHLPDSWLFSDSFLRRSFAVWGHYIVANLIIFGGVAIVFLIVAFVVKLFGMNLA